MAEPSRPLINALFVRIDAHVRHISAAQLFWTLVIIDLLLLAAVALMTAGSSGARFSIDARSEIVEVQVGPGEPMAGWGDIAANSIIGEGGSADCINPTLKMPLRVEGPFRLVVRSDYDGMLTIEFFGAAAGALGRVKCGDVERPADRHLVIDFTADQARRLTLPIRGKLTVGQDVRFDMSGQPILLDGIVLAEASSAPFRTGRFSSETRLFAGDRVIFTRGDGKTPVSSSGFLRMKDGAIGVVAHANAAEAQVIHVGQTESRPESVAPSFLAKVQAQSQWAVLLIVLAILLHMLSALRDYLFERARVEQVERARGGAR